MSIHLTSSCAAAVFCVAVAASAQTTNQTPGQAPAQPSGTQAGRTPTTQSASQVTVTGCLVRTAGATGSATDYVLMNAMLADNSDAHAGVNTGATSSNGAGIQSATGTGTTDRIGPTAGITGSGAGATASGTTSAGTTGGAPTAPAPTGVTANANVGANTGSANSSPVSYALTGARARELGQYVGRRVEVIGTMNAPAAAGTASRIGDSSRDGNAAIGVDARGGDRATSGADVRSTDRSGSTVGSGAVAGATSGTTSTGTTARDTDAGSSRGEATGTTGTRSGSPGAVTIPGSTATSANASHQVNVVSFRTVSGSCQ